jgi:co-chaperonin GroES (HSP10)
MGIIEDTSAALEAKTPGGARTTAQLRARRLLERTQALDPQHELLQKALAEPLLRRLKRVIGDKILCTHPYELCRQQQQTKAGLFKAAISDRIKETGDRLYVVTVLRTGTTIHEDDVRPGDQVCISQYAGCTIADLDDAGRDTYLWMIGMGDVLFVCEPPGVAEPRWDRLALSRSSVWEKEKEKEIQP